MKRYNDKYYFTGLVSYVKGYVKTRGYQRNTKYKDGYQRDKLYIDIDVLDSSLLQELYK